MSVYFDKKANKYFIQFDYLGKTYKKRLPKEIGKKEAEKIEAKFKSDLFFESHGLEIKRDILFEDYLTDYFLPFAENHYSPEGYKNVLVILKCALKFLKGKFMRRIKRDDIEQFKHYRMNLKTMHKRKRKENTVNRELNVLSKAFSYAVDNYVIDFNPCSKVERPVYDDTQNEILPDNLLEQFLSELQSSWAREIVILILNTGLRQKDALSLNRSHVDFKTRYITIVQSKTGRKVSIPMNDTVYLLLKSKLGNGSFLFFPSPKTGEQGKSIKKALTGACKRAKISNFGTRVLRRTFGTALGELNYQDSTVAKLLGHKDTRVVHRYKREKDILREAVGSLDKTNSAKILPFADKRQVG